MYSSLELSQRYSVLARFDCDLSLNLEDPEMKECDIFNDPEINFKFGLTADQRKRIENDFVISLNNSYLNFFNKVDGLYSFTNSFHP